MVKDMGWRNNAGPSAYGMGVPMRGGGKKMFEIVSTVQKPIVTRVKKGRRLASLDRTGQRQGGACL